MRFAVGRLPRTMADVLEVARVAEEAGFWGLGVGDSHYLYHDLYPAVTACLLRTERLVVGPCVTNAVSRSWSVHAGTARALEELAPGRFVLGIATGDGSVHSIGLAPQRWADLEADIVRIRERSPDGLEVHVTASGPKGAAVAGRVGDAIMIAVGDDPDATTHLAEIARTARREAGITTPLQVWVMIGINVVDRLDDVAEARDAMTVTAIGTGRFAFASTFEGKNVPEELQGPLRSGLSRYTHQHHASRAADNPNRLLFDDRPDVLEYLIDRMLVVGTRDQCAARITALAEAVQLDGMWLSVTPPDGAGIVRRAGEAFGHLFEGAATS